MFNPDQMLVTLLQSTVAAGASDLHLSVGRPPSARRDGVLIPFEGVGLLTPQDTERIVVLSVGGLPAQRARRGTAGRLLLRYRRPRPLQCKRLQATQHLALALRVVPFRVRSLEELGAPAAATDMLEPPYGLVLVVGPTGSGKSTTLAAMIDRINETKPVHILTIEDPVEYLHSATRWRWSTSARSAPTC